MYLFYGPKITRLPGPFRGPFQINMVMERPMCPICRRHPVALNYYRKDRAYYRSACTGCIHRGRTVKTEPPAWVKSGYKKSDRCDRCGYKLRHTEQSTVYYADGNTANNNWLNLKTVCLNCQIDVGKTRWRPSNLTPDF